MKNFEKPFVETIRFSGSILSTSGCGCDCTADEYGLFSGEDCTADKPAACTCEINHVAGTANCTPCSEYGG